MKILVVSLLRLGDVIQQEVLIDGLRKKYPDCQIDLLVNSQFSQLRTLFGSKINHIHYFDRNALQRGLGEAGFNMMWSFDRLGELITDINEGEYDQIINFTHNKLSAYLVGTFKAPKKLGLHQADGRFCGLDNSWIKYFNDRFSGASTCLFHYIELLAGSFGIPLPEAELELASPAVTSNGKRVGTIFLQCLTSEDRKNWGLDKFKALKQELNQSLAAYKVKILAAPFEKEKLLTEFAEEDLEICSMSEAKDLLKSAALLITLDTSIKHLAARLGTPIVELALGGSDLKKTGAYGANAVGLQGQDAKDISVDQVFAAAWDQLSGEKKAPKFDQNYLDKIVWRQALDGQKVSLTELVSLATTLNNRQSAVVSHWSKKTDEMLLAVKQLREVLPSNEDIGQRSALSASEVSQIVAVAQMVVREKIDSAGYFQRPLEVLLGKHRDALHFVEQMRTALQEAEELLRMREEIVVSLQTATQGGYAYAKGIGQLSGVGFEETGKRIPKNLEDADL